MAKKNSYASYLAMDGHEGYYQNPVSFKIRYIKVHNGQTVRISTKKTKITEAKKIVDERLIEMFAENPKKEKLKRRGIHTPLVAHAWAELMEDRSVDRHKNTMKGYEVSWQYGIEPFWGNKLVTSLIDPKEMISFKKWYLAENPTRVFFNTGKHLQMLIRHCRLSGYIDKNAIVPDLDEVIKTRTQKEDVGRVYTSEELAACLEHATSEMVRVGILCYRYMGMRKNELLKAERKRWDFKRSSATIWSEKNKKWRTIVIPEIVAKPLQAFVESSPDSKYLFPSKSDPKRFMASQVFDKQWSKTKVAAGISGALIENAARIHDWRHTFATQTATDNWPPIVACYVLDMSLEEYQKTYTHVTPADILKMMTKSFGGLK